MVHMSSKSFVCTELATMCRETIFNALFFIICRIEVLVAV